MYFKGKNVLIIGGTGTIGKSLLKHILVEEPGLIRVYSRDEFKQHQMQNEWVKHRNVEFMLGDVRDFDRVLAAMERIDYAFHVAALKHVGACEENPYEAVLTNIMGTHNVIKAAQAKHVEKVVFTSTDKAISPTNTYGATKLIAERLVAGTHTFDRDPPTIAIVRFGNVIGSRGSVIPLFIHQIRSNRRITVTDPNMSRFMMTLGQATRLTAEAMKSSLGGEVFVLKMPVVRIDDLTRAVIETTAVKYGLDPASITIKKIGSKPGEKLFEELMTEEESEIALETDDMFIIPPRKDPNREYRGAVRAKRGLYGSDRVQPMSIEQIRRLLEQEQLV